jgi:hypothetical protein
VAGGADAVDVEGRAVRGDPPGFPSRRAVEQGEVGRFRRNHLVPVPQVSTIAELNALLDVWDQEDEGRRIADRTRTVGEFFAIERPLLAPLPQEAFETGTDSCCLAQTRARAGHAAS